MSRLRLAALPLVLLACAHGPGRTTLLERSAAAHTYALPPEQVWREALTLVEREGYDLPPAPLQGEFSLRTPWRLQGEVDLAHVFTRYIVLGQRDEAGRFAIRFFLVSYPTIGTTAPHPGMGGGHRDAQFENMNPGDPYSPVKPSIRRDLALEWKLLQRLEPERAARIERDAERYLASRPD